MPGSKWPRHSIGHSWSHYGASGFLTPTVCMLWLGRCYYAQNLVMSTCRLKKVWYCLLDVQWRYLLSRTRVIQDRGTMGVALSGYIYHYRLYILYPLKGGSPFRLALQIQIRILRGLKYYARDIIKNCQCTQPLCLNYFHYNNMYLYL